jgi:hypothetical protein
VRPHERDIRPGAYVAYRCATCNRISHDPGGNCEHDRFEGLTLSGVLVGRDGRSLTRPQWCPVCKTYHGDVGEQTDAGLITRACPLLPTDNPRYFGSPLYTGDRG